MVDAFLPNILKLSNPESHKDSGFHRHCDIEIDNPAEPDQRILCVPSVTARKISRMNRPRQPMSMSMASMKQTATVFARSTASRAPMNAPPPPGRPSALPPPRQESRSKLAVPAATESRVPVVPRQPDRQAAAAAPAAGAADRQSVRAACSTRRSASRWR